MIKSLLDAELRDGVPRVLQKQPWVEALSRAVLDLLLRGAPVGLRALLLAVCPWLCTGFLHLDGYMDVCDAVLSRRDLATRQRILKDSHCGAFAVICMVLLALAQWSVFLQEKNPAWLPLLLIPACFLGGGAFCLMCDLIARTAFAPTEVSISSVTAIFGAPVVIYMMVRRKAG